MDKTSTWLAVCPLIGWSARKDAVVYNRHRNYAIFIRCSQSDLTRDTISDDKTKHVTSFGKGRKRRRLQFRQARAGQLTTVAVAVSAPPVGSDSESDANDSDSRYSPVTLQVLFLLHLADKILSRVHVFCDYIIIEGNQHACLAAYVPCNKNTVISSVNGNARARPRPLAWQWPWSWTCEVAEARIMVCNLFYSLVVVLVSFHTNFQLCRLL